MKKLFPIILVIGLVIWFVRSRNKNSQAKTGEKPSFWDNMVSGVYPSIASAVSSVTTAITGTTPTSSTTSTTSTSSTPAEVDTTSAATDSTTTSTVTRTVDADTGKSLPPLEPFSRSVQPLSPFRCQN